MSKSREFGVGQRVQKSGGDYSFEGRIVAAFQKWNRELTRQGGAWRYVVQNREGLLHIFNGNQLWPLGEKE